MNRTGWRQERRIEKFLDLLSRWERRDLSMMEAGEVLGCSEYQFPRFGDRYEEQGLAGLADNRLGKVLAKRVPVDQVMWMVAE